MSAPRRLPDLVCANPACRRVFRPDTLKRAQNPNATCSPHCKAIVIYQRHPHALAEASGRAASDRLRQRIEAAARAQFGELTTRERQIFTFARQAGYDSGYAVAYGRMARRTDRSTKRTVAA